MIFSPESPGVARALETVSHVPAVSHHPTGSDIIVLIYGLTPS
jgi:hypothetical protein